MVRKHIVFTNWDFLRDLGRVNPGATDWWPQPSSSSRAVPPLGDEPSKLDTSFTEATTQTISPAANDVELIRHITPQNRIEEENQYLLVIMNSIKQLSLGSVGNDLRELSAAPLERILSGTHIWQPFTLDQQGQSVIQVPP